MCKLEHALILASSGKQLDEALLEKQREAYAVPGVDENSPAQINKKRKNSSNDVSFGPT
jgi:hypothetical protein